ncbi:MAG: hypothetical protein MK076_00945 [Flavobacteriales bacterium]|nr:hypothetical protein [Flavobacteriales bacterium]
MSCGNLTANFTLDCDDQPVGGVSSTLFIFNFSDFSSWDVTLDSTNKSQVTSIVAPTGQTGFKIEGEANTVRPTTEVIKEGGRTRYRHLINFEVGGLDAEAVNYVSSLNKGTYVCILVLNAKQIYIYGNDSGVETVGQPIQDLYANSGVFTLQFASLEETPETKPPLVYTGATSPYDFATALAEIESLILA